MVSGVLYIEDMSNRTAAATTADTSALIGKGYATHYINVLANGAKIAKCGMTTEGKSIRPVSHGATCVRCNERGRYRR